MSALSVKFVVIATALALAWQPAHPRRSRRRAPQHRRARSTSTQSSTGTGGTDQAGVAAAKAALQSISADPTSVGLTETLNERPVGKRIYEMEFPGPPRRIHRGRRRGGLQGELFGCIVTRIPIGNDPASEVAAWKRAVRDKPDAVVSGGTEADIVGTQIKQLRAEGVPVVSFISDTVAGTEGVKPVRTWNDWRRMPATRKPTPSSPTRMATQTSWHTGSPNCP